MSHKFAYFKLFLVIFVCGILFGIVYQNDLMRPKVRHPDVPAFVHVAIKNYNEKVANHFVRDVHFGPSAWQNDKDFGSKNDWNKIEKDGFVIYYKNDKEGKWHMNAQSVLTELSRTKQQMKDAPRGVSAPYIEPQSVNNRMLPFYLPSTDEEYEMVVQRLAGSSAESIYKYRDSDVYGYSLSEFGPLGFKPAGIVLKPAAFDVAMNEKGSYRDAALAGLEYYEHWAAAELALFIIEDAPAGTVPSEYLAKMTLAGEVGAVMLEAMAADSLYMSAMTAIADSAAAATAAADSIAAAEEPMAEEAVEEIEEELPPAPKSKKGKKSKAKSPYLPE